MNSNIVPVIMALIVIAFAAAAYYYFHSGDTEADRPVTGVVLDKFERVAGAGAADRPLVQGVRSLAGRSLQQGSSYFVRILTTSGQEVDLQVPADVYRRAELGDKITRASSGSTPVLVR
jgi:hypothetical protein